LLERQVSGKDLCLKEPTLIKEKIMNITLNEGQKISLNYTNFHLTIKQNEKRLHDGIPFITEWYINNVSLKISPVGEKHIGIYLGSAYYQHIDSRYNDFDVDFRIFNFEGDLISY